MYRIQFSWNGSYTQGIRTLENFNVYHFAIFKDSQVNGLPKSKKQTLHYAFRKGLQSLEVRHGSGKLKNFDDN